MDNRKSGTTFTQHTGIDYISRHLLKRDRATNSLSAGQSTPNRPVLVAKGSRARISWREVPVNGREIAIVALSIKYNSKTNHCLLLGLGPAPTRSSCFSKTLRAVQNSRFRLMAKILVWRCADIYCIVQKILLWYIEGCGELHYFCHFKPRRIRS